MKILFFTQSIAYGGDDTVLIEVVRHWPETTDERIVVLNASHPGLDSYETALGSDVRVIRLNEKTIEEGLCRGPIAFTGAVLRIRKFISALDPAAIIASSGGYPPTALLWRFLWAAALVGIPRRLLAVHNYPPADLGRLRRVYLRLIGKLTPLLVGRMASVSEDCSRAISAYSGAPVTAILNGSSLRPETMSISDKRIKLNVSAGPLIGAIGNLESRKGFEYLIRAMKKVPDANLVIIGHATQEGHKEYLDGLIEELQLRNRVVLTGHLPDAGKFVECFDICVVPSVTHESFGLLCLDAMRYKKPIIVTRVGGLPEVVEDGRTGIIVPPADSNSIAAACSRLLASPDESRAMGRNGHERLRKTFSGRRMAKAYYDITVNT